MSNTSLRVVKFWTNYVPNADGTVKSIDMVEYCAVGMAGKSTTVAPISALAKLRPVQPNSEDMAGHMAHNRWSAIRPAYEAWKAGHAAPVRGTPLAAWPGVTQEQAELVRIAGITSVEDLADAPDTVISKIQLPGARDLKMSAIRFCESKDTAKTAAALAEKDSQIANLSEQLEELRQMIIADSEEKRRRPGRPRKDEAEAAA